MKFLRWLDNNILFIITLFLLAFIPLYPKLPLLDVKHTWVYIRIEDFLIAVAVGIWFMQLLRKKVTFKTPLTVPIVLFWGIGLLSTLIAINFIFPQLKNVFPNIAFLHLFRRFEYLSVFFIAFAAVRNKQQLKYIIGVIAVTLILVSLYGFGQRGFIVGFDNRFPAFSTMNEEFAKGIPLLISAANRVQSTFAGHYDLAAYLVMMIPVMGALVFAVKKWYGKVFYIIAAAMGLVLLLMTASRVSFAVYLLTMSFMLILHKQKKFILPVVIISVLLMSTFQGMAQRFASTVRQVDLVVDARTGQQIGVGKETVDPTGESKYVIEENPDNGENLNTGSSYVVPVKQEEEKTTKNIVITKQVIKAGQMSTEETGVDGDFVIKKALAYDISFTTRFQGTWPRAIDAFKRNMLLGSGYSSISLASDNNYLRILGEVGILGLASFLLIFIILSIYAYRVFPEINSQIVKSFIIGIMAGLFGLALNATLIDVFEASKVAFVLWLLVGVTAGTLHQYQKKPIHYMRNLKLLFTSLPAYAVYLFALALAVYSVTFQNYFVADDFTWLRWAADCNKIKTGDFIMSCEPIAKTFVTYFTQANNFFYRPGTKIYFHFLYNYSWLNANIYHIFSVLIHFVVSVIVLLLSTKLLKSKLFGLLAAGAFLVLRSHSEAVLWISSVGHIIAALFILSGLLFHIYWRETKKNRFILPVIVSIFAAPLFQETGIIAAPLIILFDVFVLEKGLSKKTLKNRLYWLYILPAVLYLALRSYAKSFWSGGDYSYNMLKLPFNIVGNALGYLGIVLAGAGFIPVYDQLRSAGKENVVLVILPLLFLTAALIVLINVVKPHINNELKQILMAGGLLFIVPLIPVLGLGNATLRYSYLASSGIVLLLIYFLKVLTMYIRTKNKFVSGVVILLFTVLFFGYQINGLYESNKDWKRAGEITENLLFAMNYTFPGQKATPPNPVFYFVNTPMKTGEAWVFPVGLEDSLWFTFQNSNLTVHKADNVPLALDAAEGSTSARIFEFDPEGNIQQVIKTETPVQ